MKTAKHTVLILSLICVIPLLFSCASGRGISASDVRAGMSSDKLYCMLGTYGVYYGHDGDRLLFRDKKNRSVTVEFSEDMKTVAAVSSAAANPTDTDIGKITGGMTASEVYAALGAPVGRDTSGVYSELFVSSSGNYYRICWSKSWEEPYSVTVQSVQSLGSDRVPISPVTTQTE